VYVADQMHIRVVSRSTGIVTTFAGQGGLMGSTGNGGAATSAQLSNIAGVAVDASGNVFITDSNKVREVATPAASAALPTAAPSSSPVR